MLAHLFFAAASAAFFASASSAAEPDTVLQNEVIFPTVRVFVGDAVGSGTVIFSGERGGKTETYILTNNHVVESAVVKKNEAAGTPEYVQKIRVSIPIFDGKGNIVGNNERSAAVVARDVLSDLAAVKLDDATAVPHVATLMPSTEDVTTGEPVWAIGAGLGVPPVPTYGFFGYKNNEIDGKPYQIATAATVFGNSGGGLYHKDNSGHYDLVGVPARITSLGGGFMSSPTPVTHLGYSIQIETVREFLKKNALRFIVEENEKAADDDVKSGLVDER